MRGGIGGPGGSESVSGGLLNGEEITLAGFELVDDLLSSSPMLFLVLALTPLGDGDAHSDTTALYSSS